MKSIGWDDLNVCNIAETNQMTVYADWITGKNQLHSEETCPLQTILTSEKLKCIH